MKLDRNQFLLLATAIGAGVMGTAAKSYDPPVSSFSKQQDDVEQDQSGGTCDGDTGQTGRAKYCPIQEGRNKGCLDWSSCDDSHLKAASELRLYDCLANKPRNTCFTEGQMTAFERCARDMIPHACSDPQAAQVCARVQRGCAGHMGSMMGSCATWVTPLNATGKAQFASCMVEGCDDYQFKSCLGYVR